MKYKAFSKPALAISTILVVAACAANADDVPEGEQQTPAPTNDAGTTLPPENKPPENKPPEKKCASSCTKNEDCATTCADPGTGAVNCCDTATSQCYKAAAAVCPAPTGDPDGGAAPY
ncbi:MAG: hypothetical protein JST00_16430 [Deltaproteobacteria bacterium]|nr:hypothetical protein [Deltaproteobacteria bacterium]